MAALIPKKVAKVRRSDDEDEEDVHNPNPNTNTNTNFVRSSYRKRRWHSYGPLEREPFLGQTQEWRSRSNKPVASSKSCLSRWLTPMLLAIILVLLLALVPETQTKLFKFRASLANEDLSGYLTSVSPQAARTQALKAERSKPVIKEKRDKRSHTKTPEDILWGSSVLSVQDVPAVHSQSSDKGGKKVNTIAETTKEAEHQRRKTLMVTPKAKDEKKPTSRPTSLIVGGGSGVPDAVLKTGPGPVVTPLDPKLKPEAKDKKKPTSRPTSLHVGGGAGVPDAVLKTGPGPVVTPLDPRLKPEVPVINWELKPEDQPLTIKEMLEHKNTFPPKSNLIPDYRELLPKEKPLRVAILFTGAMRTLALVWPNWEMNVVEPNDADLFWSINYEPRLKSDLHAMNLVKSHPRTVAYHFVDYSPKNQDMIFSDILNRTRLEEIVPQFMHWAKKHKFTNGFSVDMFLGWTTGFQLIEAHGLEKYDVIIRARPDLSVHSPLIVTKELLGTTGLAIPKCDDFHGFNDRIWVGKADLMYELFGDPTWYVQFTRNQGHEAFLCCEEALKYYLQSKGIRPLRFALNYATIKYMYAYYWWIHHNNKIAHWGVQACDMRLELRPQQNGIPLNIFPDATTWVQQEELLLILESYEVTVRPWGQCAGYPCVVMDDGSVVDDQGLDTKESNCPSKGILEVRDRGRWQCFDYKAMKDFFYGMSQIPQKWYRPEGNGEYGGPMCSAEGELCECTGTVRLRNTVHWVDRVGINGSIPCDFAFFPTFKARRQSYWHVEVLKPVWCECFPDLNKINTWTRWNRRDRAWLGKEKRFALGPVLPTVPELTIDPEDGFWYFAPEGPLGSIHFEVKPKSNPILENVEKVIRAWWAEEADVDWMEPSAHDLTAKVNQFLVDGKLAFVNPNKYIRELLNIPALPERLAIRYIPRTLPESWDIGKAEKNVE